MVNEALKSFYPKEPKGGICNLLQEGKLKEQVQKLKKQKEKYGIQDE